MSKVSRAKSLSPDELILRTVRARRRFKALVWTVIANIRWLEDDDDEQLSRNVKKNVQLLTKRKGKKSLLTLQQKSILCKPAEYRTEQEKLLLNRIIGGLKCFRKYPENVKMQLAGVTYFVYFGPGRVIVRQNHEAHALYFIVTGEVMVSITTFDPVIKETITVNVGTMVAGSMFGEVSLLHDIPRTATITTATPCELLCLKKADFDIVLKASVKHQWDEIQRAMSRFTYFDGWDEVATRECCIYSKIKPYHREQTVLGDGTGIPTSTYFILKGKCRVIEHLLVEVTFDRHGTKHYKLYNPPKTKRELDKSDLPEKPVLDERKASAATLPGDRAVSAFTYLATKPKSSRASAASPTRMSLKPTRTTSLKKLQETVAGRGTSADRSGSPGSPVAEEEARTYIDLGRSPSEHSIVDLPRNVETHFMQVCIFSETACFGLGENMRHRRVVAMSDYVECLMIPRYWLMQKNKGNLWTRIQQFLNTQIPTTQQVFNEFIGQRKWFQFRRNLATELFGKPPVNHYYNIPYAIRINEDIDFE